MDVDTLITEILADLKAGRLQLPTLPQVALKINDAIDDPDTSVKKVAKVLSTDAALSARVIQVANSPLIRGSTPVENVQSAVMRMGIKSVRNLVTSLLVRQMFHTRYPVLKQRITLIWRHSVHVAAISYVLALHHSTLKPDEAMLAGLIHDIGKLPIIGKAENHPDLAKDPGMMDTLASRLHPALGKVILKAWHFAPEFIAVAAEHENLTRESDQLDLTDIVTVANLHSYAGNKHSSNPHQHVDWNTVPAFRRLDLDPSSSMDVLKEAREEIHEVQRLLGA